MTIIYNRPYFNKNALLETADANGHSVIDVSSIADFTLYPQADLYIDAAFDGNFANVGGPLLFHCPAYTFKDLPLAPANSARFCAWPGFWERKRWDIALHPENTIDFSALLVKIGIETSPVSDIPGLIAPRILGTLINEAAYTLADGIASAPDIDTSMKLGTNYPKGPVEWAIQIGFSEIEKVLSQMALTQPHYAPHPMLKMLIFTRRMSDYILHIDTASSRGLVMLSVNGQCVAKKENLNPHDHAAFLQPAVKSLLEETHIKPQQITCIAVANGPGSYTGLRVGLAGAKGLCYAWEKPLLTISSLHLLAKAMQLQVADFQTALPRVYVPMIDARRMEVFYAVYQQDNEHIIPLLPPAASVLDEIFITSLPSHAHLFFGGDGSPKWEHICPLTNVSFIKMDTTDIAFALIAAEQADAANWADLAYSEPFYAKAFYSPTKISTPNFKI